MTMASASWSCNCTTNSTDSFLMARSFCTQNISLRSSHSYDGCAPSCSISRPLPSNWPPFGVGVFPSPHPKSFRSLQWQCSGSLHGQRSRFSLRSLETLMQPESRALRRDGVLRRLDGKTLIVRAGVAPVAIEENVQEELEQETQSCDDVNACDFAVVLAIMKVDDKFRYHKVPKFKALKLGAILEHSLVLRILKHRDVKPSNAWKFFVWAKKQMGFKHTAEAYNTIIPTLLEIKKFTSVFYLLEDMYKDGVRLTPETCVRMAKSFGSAGMVERAIRALSHMTSLGSPATTHQLNSVVSELLKSQHHYKAYIAYREMAKTGCEPDGLTFKLLLRALARVGKFELACRIFDDMEMRSCEPDAEVASILVGILSESGRIDDGVAVFEKAKDKGIKMNAKVYNHLLNGLGEVGAIEKGLEIAEEMRTYGYRPEQDLLPAFNERV